jgi:transcriptional regulator GlxA family with amidase domain
MDRVLSQNDVTSALIELIAQAESALETNRATTKACLARACALLRTEGDTKECPVALPDRGGLAPWQKQRVRAHIETHLSSRIAMSDLTSIARLSTSHFARAFKTSFGAAPFAYISQLRIERAKQLMLHSDAALSQIALECGMCDQSHFTRVFRRVAGDSPNNWRRGHCNGEPIRPVTRRTAAERQSTIV